MALRDFSQDQGKLASHARYLADLVERDVRRRQEDERVARGQHDVVDGLVVRFLGLGEQVLEVGFDVVRGEVAG